MPYILDLRVDVGVVTGIFAVPTFHTLVTLGMTPSLFHLFLFSSLIPLYIGSVLIGSLFFSFIKSIFYTLGEDIQST